MLHCELSIFLVADWRHFNRISMSWPLVFWILLQHFLEEVTVWTIWLWEAWDSRSPPPKKKGHVTCFVWSVEQGRATDWRQLHFKLYVESSSAGRLVALTLAGSASVIKAFTLPCLISNYLRRFRPIWLLFQLGRQPKTQIGLGAMQSHSHVGKNVQLTKTPPPLAWNNHARWKTKHPCPILCFSKGKLLPFFRGVRFKIRYCIPKQQNLKGCYLLQEDSVT